jgi:hypothetical protein
VKIDAHIHDQLEAYLDGELSQAAIAQTESHLAQCPQCRTELDRIRTGKVSLQHLPLAPAPDDLWRSIEAAASAHDRQEDYRFASWRYVAAGLALAVAGALYQGYVRTPSDPWEVAALNGSPLAGGRPMSEVKSAFAGQWIETDGASRARIKVAEIGAVDVEPNTRVRLLSTGVNGHRLALGSGSIMAKISAPPRLFFVETPSGTAVDLGCEYRLQCDRKGVGLLSVTSGWVSFEWKGMESLVPGGASCRTRPDRPPGIPYFDDASPLFVEAIERLDSPERRPEDLETILSEARIRDTLSLWHLLSRVEGSERSRVYSRAAALAPPPSGVTPERVLSLDAGSLKQWKDEMAWTW